MYWLVSPLSPTLFIHFLKKSCSRLGLAGGPSLVYAVCSCLKEFCSCVNETVSFGGLTGGLAGGPSLVYAVCSFLKKLCSRLNETVSLGALTGALAGGPSLVLRRLLIFEKVVFSFQRDGQFWWPLWWPLSRPRR